MNLPAMGGLMEPCATCGHVGFSHDNWEMCAECDCEVYRLPERFERAEIPEKSPKTPK